MIKILFKNSEIKIEESTNLREIAKKQGVKNICLAKINENIKDLDTVITEDCSIKFIDFSQEEGKKVYWHTCAHVLAQAIKRLYPFVKCGIGPAVDTGFYYDFDFGNVSFSKNDFDKVNNEIKNIVKSDFKLEKLEVSFEEAIKIMNERGEKYKIELINELNSKKEKIIFYKQGEYVDLCVGPHLYSTGYIGEIKLTNITGAYWRGDAKNNMLVRIYGTAFPTKKELEEFLISVEEARKFDHNKIGRTLGYFTTVDYIGQGLPILMPKGAKVIQILQRFIEDEEERRGYLLTKTPFLAKSDLYKISGHWSHYRESMFILGDETKDNEVFALRPMTCPFQFQVYLSGKRSYRDLPMRLNETSTLFRNEQSGEMHGLIRIRQFTISEGHIACTPQQLTSEFEKCLELAKFVLASLKFENDIFYRFSKWDKNNREKYIGSKEEWEKVQNEMRVILDQSGVEYDEVDGEAAFYGPKLDIQFKNVYGKEDTLITIQIDFQLARRFDMFFTDFDGTVKHPYIIHRTSLGCYERTLAMLIEKYAGALPIWLAPEQVRILPINENLIEPAKKLMKNLINSGIRRVSVDFRNEKIGYKIRSAQEEKIPFMLIFGNEELENNSVSVRSCSENDIGKMSVKEFVDMAIQKIKDKT
ncbi:MAG: threonine--tRNA ligase [Oscillospiraceae bacterium]|nr:threonine--tRNA ligase [Oscillospiraceae bacterium]